MNAILMSILAVSAIGLICGIMLVVAAKFMTVKVDERAAAIREALPGANCGACGYPGCDGYANAIVADGIKTNLCVPGGDATSRIISGLLGVEFEDVAARIAVCHCGGADGIAVKKMQYEGVQRCAAVKMHYGGEGACTFGCLGYGDCVTECQNDAITVVNGVAQIDSSLCSGCGLCTHVCPNGVISTHDSTVKVVVSCVSLDRGADVRRKCTHGCIGCGKCARECPADAITIEENLAVIDYEKCTSCGHCAEVCITKCIYAANPARQG